MCDKNMKPIDINDDNMEQTLGHWRDFLGVITADGRIPYITINFAAIEFIHDPGKIRSWQLL